MRTCTHIYASILDKPLESSFFQGQLFDVKVELPTEWLLWKITDVKYTRLKRVVAGRERGEGQFFAGDMITLQCQEGYEFAVNEITSTVQVTTDGFQGRTLCERELFSAIMMIHFKYICADL